MPGSPASNAWQPRGDAVSAAALTGPLQAALPGRTGATQRARAITRRPLGPASPRRVRAASCPLQRQLSGGYHKAPGHSQANSSLEETRKGQTR